MEGGGVFLQGWAKKMQAGILRRLTQSPYREKNTGGSHEKGLTHRALDGLGPGDYRLCTRGCMYPMILLRPPVRQLEETVWIGPHTCAVPVNSSSWIAGAEERGDRKGLRTYCAEPCDRCTRDGQTVPTPKMPMVMKYRNDGEMMIRAMSFRQGRISTISFSSISPEP